MGLGGIVAFLCVEKLVRIMKGGHSHSHSAPAPAVEEKKPEPPKKKKAKESDGEEEEKEEEKGKKAVKEEEKKEVKEVAGGDIKVAGFLKLAASTTLLTDLLLGLVSWLEIQSEL